MACCMSPTVMCAILKACQTYLPISTLVCVLCPVGGEEEYIGSEGSDVDENYQSAVPFFGAPPKGCVLSSVSVLSFKYFCLACDCSIKLSSMHIAPGILLWSCPLVVTVFNRAPYQALPYIQPSIRTPTVPFLSRPTHSHIAPPKRPLCLPSHSIILHSVHYVPALLLMLMVASGY